jgi:hypothetical protein
MRLRAGVLLHFVIVIADIFVQSACVVLKDVQFNLFTIHEMNVFTSNVHFMNYEQSVTSRAGFKRQHSILTFVVGFVLLESAFMCFRCSCIASFRSTFNV